MHSTLSVQNRIQGISLRDVLPECRFVGTDEIRIASCCEDSRKCQPGDLFASLVGAEYDGHDFVNEAIANGASALLAERLPPVSMPTCLVSDTREAFGRICQAIAGNPSQKMRVIGITGTHGKTTTSMLVASVLKAAGMCSGIMGSLGTSDAVETNALPMVTPAAPELASWLARSHANGCSHAILEISSFGLAQKKISGIEFDAAILTNIRKKHLDFHGSVLNYRKAKARLFQQLKPAGFAVINADDPASQHLLSKIENPVMTVGMRQPAELSATVVERHKSEQTFLLSAGSETVPVRTRMIGDHHVNYCLAAAAVGLIYGIDLPTVARGLEAIDFVPGKLQQIECGQTFGVYVDDAHDPDAFSRSLKTLRRLTSGRLICVFGAKGGCDFENRPILGRVVERGADLGVITNDNPGEEKPLSIAHDILDGYDRPGIAHVLPDREKAIHWALEQAQESDTVYIAGKGNQNYQIIGENRLPFNDCEIAQSFLYQKFHCEGEPWINTG